MNEEGEVKKEGCRPWWQNCVEEATEEILAIDKIEDAIAPLGEQTTRIRQLIMGLEPCYHEADKEAERIVKAIGCGQCPEETNERPPQRKKELEDCYRILSGWCEDTAVKDMDSEFGGISAEELLSYIGEASPLKVWQVERIVDKVTEALDRSKPYHMMVLDMGDYGEPGARPLGEHYKDAAEFLQQTKETIIHDTVDGQEAKMSLAMAIDMLEPCNWDFVGSIVTLLKAIGGELHPERPYVCHQRNLKLSPLCDRLRTISNTLGVFWKEEETNKKTDQDILDYLGEVTPVKRWLAASLDKTIRLQLEGPSDFWLGFS
ncbi:MAG: hypothetical protein ACYSUY_17900 [Planctomycetota bacterium]|jgi:hypothetical protein